jgi:VCBS repeat-containing protein
MRKKYKLITWIGLFAALMTALYFGVFAGSEIKVELSKSGISENMDVGSVVGTLTISGTGTIQAVTLKNGEDLFDPNFNLVSEDGSYQLVTKAVFDYEKINSYTVTVRVTDEEKTEDKSLTVSVTNVDEKAPIANSVSIATDEDTAKSGRVTATDDEEASNPLTYSAPDGAEKPQYGTLNLAGNGNYTYTPNAEFRGSDSFTFKAFDGTNYSDWGTVTITVNAVNDAPKNTDIPTVTGTNFHAGDTLTAANGTWTDVDSDIGAATYSYQWQTAGTDGGTATDITDAKSSTYSLVSKEGGKYIRVKVSCTNDGVTADAYSAWQEVKNAAPEITTSKPASMTFIEDGAAKEISLAAGDEDGDALTWSVKTDGTKGHANISDSTVTYTPNANVNGDDSFEVSVTDGSATDSIIVNVSITAENDLPVNGTKPSFTGTMKTGGVLTAGKGTWSDVETTSDNLVYSYQWQTALTNAPSAPEDITNVASAAAETFTVAAADKGKYIRVKVTCSDGKDTVEAYSDWESVGNTAPVIKKDDPSSLIFLEDGVAQDLTFKASDADSDALTWAIKTDGTKGHATISGSTATYTPNANENGSDSFVVSVSDGTDKDTITVSVSITSVNDKPSFTDIANQTVLEDCGAQTVANCTMGSKGPANESTQTLTYTVANNNNDLFSAQPAISPTGTLTYTPKADANGSATVTVTLSDNGGKENGGVDTSAARTFTITVDAVNDTPSFTNRGNQTVAEDYGSQTVSKWADNIYIGPENENTQTYSFEVSTNNNALFGTLPAIDTDGNLTYTPADNANGSATVTVYLKDSGDGANTSAAAIFTISVTAENDKPTLTGDDAISTNEDTPFIYHFTVGDVEDTAGSLALSWDTSDTSLLTKANMVLGGSGTDRTLTLTPVANRSGNVNVTITVKDSGGLSVTRTVVFTVNAVNDAPVISDIADRTINEDISSGAIGFAISDVDSSLTGCDVTAVSSNQSVIAAAGVHLDGSGANRTITLTPVANSSGETTITITVDDKSGSATAVTTATFKVTVSAVDDAPIIDDIASLTINEEADTGDILFNFSDVDDTALTVSASTDNTAMIPKANIILTKKSDTSYSINVKPVTNKFGTATITVTVKDPSGLMATDSFVLTVKSVNDTPTLDAISAQSTNEDTAKAVSLNISDIETPVGDLDLSAVSSNAAVVASDTDHIKLTGSGATRTLTLIPNQDAHGSTDITVTVTDKDGGTAEQTFTLTVTAVNDAPSFAKGADISEEEDCGAESYFGWATAISAGPDDETKDEKQTVSFTVSNDNNALFSIQPTISSVGTLSFTSAADANGYATVTVTAKDSGTPNTSSSAQTFKITLTPVNDAPAAKNMTEILDTDENQSYRGYLSGSDVDKDAIKYSITSNPANGTVTITNIDTGAFQYTPNKYFNGDDTFKFKVNDGKADSVEATVTMKVLGVNDPPVATGFSFSVGEDGTKTIDLSNPLYSSDIDSDRTKFTYSIPLNPDHGKLTPLGSGEFSYAPNGNYFGSDVFTFKVTDDKGLSSNTALVYVTVTPVDDAPVAMNEPITLTENQTLNGVFKASDLENDALAYSIVSGPDASAGTLTMLDADKGTYTFVPGANFRGTAIFSFRAAEKSTPANYSEGMVTVTMKPVNRAPEVTGTPPIVFTTEEDKPLPGNVSASDPDTGDILTYSLVSRPKHGSLEGDKINSLNGAFVYTPNSNYNGTDFFTVQAVDPSGLYTSIVLVKINITPLNDSCLAYDQWIEAIKNTDVSGNLAGYDPDGDALTYSIVADSASNGTVTSINAATGAFTFTPTTDWSGGASFKYKVSDGASTSNEATVRQLAMKRRCVN